jgi:hypothetical protein
MAETAQQKLRPQRRTAMSTLPGSPMSPVQKRITTKSNEALQFGERLPLEEMESLLASGQLQEISDLVVLDSVAEPGTADGGSRDATAYTRDGRLYVRSEESGFMGPTTTWVDGGDIE